MRLNDGLPRHAAIAQNQNTRPNLVRLELALLIAFKFLFAPLTLIQPPSGRLL